MALGEARLNRVAWSSYGSIWRWFGRNDEKTLRAMKAVDYLVHHDEQVPAIIVACVRWNTHGPIVSGVRLPFPPSMEHISRKARARHAVLVIARRRDSSGAGSAGVTAQTTRPPVSEYILS